MSKKRATTLPDGAGNKMATYTPSDEARRIFDQFYTALSEIQTKNQELYDRSLLTLSSAGLGLSVTFIKNVGGAVNHKSLLIWSWGLFGGTIVSTLASFWIAQIAIDKRIVFAENFYMKGMPNDLNRKSFAHRTVDILNLVSGIFFVIGIVCTIVFCSLNVPQ